MHICIKLSSDRSNSKNLFSQLTMDSESHGIIIKDTDTMATIQHGYIYLITRFRLARLNEYLCLIL